MIKFVGYYGDDVWIARERVLSVRDGGCGDRGVCAIVVLDNGSTVSLNARAEDVVLKLEEARR